MPGSANRRPVVRLPEGNERRPSGKSEAAKTFRGVGDSLDDLIDNPGLRELVQRFVTAGGFADVAYAVTRLRALLTGFGENRATIDRAAALLVRLSLDGAS